MTYWRRVELRTENLDLGHYRMNARTAFGGINIVVRMIEGRTFRDPNEHIQSHAAIDVDSLIDDLPILVPTRRQVVGGVPDGIAIIGVDRK